MTTNRPEFKAHDEFIFEHKEVGKVTREEFIKYIRSSHEHMRKLSEIIQQYNQTIDDYLNKWDGKFESFDEDVKDLLHLWIQDGTMDHIINENLMSTKADKTYVDDLNENVTSQLAQTEQSLSLKANKGKLPALSTEYTHKTGETSAIVFMDKDKYLFRVANNVLQRSKDSIKWDPVYEFETSLGGVRQLDNGELLVSLNPVSSINKTAQLFLSTGYPQNENLTFTKVLEAPHQDQSLGMGWGFGTHENIVVISVYDSSPINDRKPTHPVWLSTDYGNTWEIIYEHGTGSSGSSRHVHGCIYDPYRKAIWVTLGDYMIGDADSRGIIVSWDLGRTWQWVTRRHQPTAIHVFPNNVVFGSDNAPNGVLRIDEPSKENLRVDIAYKLNEHLTITHVAQTPFRHFDGDLLTIPFASVNENFKSVVLASYDGYAFFEIWKDSKTTGNIVRAIGPTESNQYILINDAGTINIELDNIEKSLIETLSQTNSYLVKTIPKRTYIHLSYALETIPPNTFTTLKFSTDIFGHDEYSNSGLFTVVEDGVIVNRKCIINAYGEIGVPFGTVNPSVTMHVNGIGVTGGLFSPVVSKTIKCNAGDKISLLAWHSSPSPVSLDGKDYALVLDAWE